MKLYKYKDYVINESLQDLCDFYDIYHYTINDDGSIDVYDSVNFGNYALDKLPIKFGKINGYFKCSGNQLTSLEGGPSEVGGDFYCYNNNLESLSNAPKKVNGDFWVDNNQLIDLKGFPEFIKGQVFIKNNPVSKILDLFNNMDKKEVIELLNEYDVIRGRKVILQALELVYDDLGLEVPENIEIEGYEII